MVMNALSIRLVKAKKYHSSHRQQSIPSSTGRAVKTRRNIKGVPLHTNYFCSTTCHRTVYLDLITSMQGSELVPICHDDCMFSSETHAIIKMSPNHQENITDNCAIDTFTRMIDTNATGSMICKDRQ